MNEGIGGNTITRDALSPPPDSIPGLERLDRDVLSHAGVTHVVLFMGTNDIRREASAAQVIAGMENIIQRVKANGLRIYGVTIIPRHNVAPSGTNTGWNPAKTAIRNQVNQWIRTVAPFDGVLDFDNVVRQPANGDRSLRGVGTLKVRRTSSRRTGRRRFPPDRGAFVSSVLESLRREARGGLACACWRNSA